MLNLSQSQQIATVAWWKGCACDPAVRAFKVSNLDVLDFLLEAIGLIQESVRRLSVVLLLDILSPKHTFISWGISVSQYLSQNLAKCCPATVASALLAELTWTQRRRRRLKMEIHWNWNTWTLGTAAHKAFCWNVSSYTHIQLAFALRLGSNWFKLHFTYLDWIWLNTRRRLVQVHGARVFTEFALYILNIVVSVAHFHKLRRWPEVPLDSPVKYQK